MWRWDSSSSKSAGAILQLAGSVSASLVVGIVHQLPKTIDRELGDLDLHLVPVLILHFHLGDALKEDLDAAFGAISVVLDGAPVVEPLALDKLVGEVLLEAEVDEHGLPIVLRGLVSERLLVVFTPIVVPLLASCHRRIC